MNISSNRIVADTNVSSQRVLFPASTPALSIASAQEQGVLLASSQTFAELTEVLLRAKFHNRLSEAKRLDILTAVEPTLEMIKIDQEVRACRDPRDDKFLSLAVSGRADVILTGDADLLALHPFRDIAILSPSDYLRLSSHPR